ncbi:MAG: hypothetical protein LRY40_00670, partial [Shewanella fodinae]|nr:hypothetical protein [Shewanella fodinae]
KSHPALVEGIAALARKTNENKALREKIIRKFKIKNTCGYSLNALVDFEDPFEIMQHLMIGSEGTLGFIKEITFKTVPEYKDKASALMLFKNIKDACEAETCGPLAPNVLCCILNLPYVGGHSIFVFTFRIKMLIQF